jgi:hypothetical protein
MSTSPSEKRIMIYQAPVAHAYNLSYSGGRNQEDLGSKSAWPDPNLEKTHHKKEGSEGAGRVAQGIGPEFKPSTANNNNNNGPNELYKI